MCHLKFAITWDTVAFDKLDWLSRGLKTRQLLLVILCRLPEKGRREIEDKEEEMNAWEGQGRKENEWKWTNRRNKISPLYPYLIQG